MVTDGYQAASDVSATFNAVFRCKRSGSVYSSFFNAGDPWNQISVPMSDSPIENLARRGERQLFRRCLSKGAQRPK